jgi:hypothetical protein
MAGRGARVSLSLPLPFPRKESLDFARLRPSLFWFSAVRW